MTTRDLTKGVMTSPRAACNRTLQIAGKTSQPSLDRAGWLSHVAALQGSIMPGRRILVTGGAGFIGSAVARMIVRDTPHRVLVVDNLGYAGNLAALAPIASDIR